MEAVVMKCNQCKKPSIFEVEDDWGLPDSHVVAKCIKCLMKGVRAVEDVMDKQIERCGLCGGWKMQYNKCGVCKK